MVPLKLKLTIAYDGTNYAGWQTQKIGLGVQQKIEEALANEIIRAANNDMASHAVKKKNEQERIAMASPPRVSSR